MRARDNPFRISEVGAIEFLTPVGDSWPEILARLDRFGLRAEIAGPHGSGKSTLLRRITGELERRGFATHAMRLCADEPRPGVRECRAWLRSAPRDAVIVVDGADLLSRFAWQTISRRSRANSGLVITTHRRGLLPTLIEPETSVELLEALVARLLGGSDSLPRRELVALYRAHGGDLRECLFALYDRWAGRRSDTASPASIANANAQAASAAGSP